MPSANFTLLEFCGNLHACSSPPGGYVEVEGELRYREYTPTDSDRNVRVAEIYAISILALERSVAQNGSAPADSDPGDEPAD